MRLQRRLLKATRKGVWASPALLAEYRRRHRYRWLERLRFAVLAVGVLVCAVGALSLIASTGYLWFSGDPAMQATSKVRSAGAALVVACLTLAALCAQTIFGGAMVCSLRHLPTHGHLPVGDRTFLRWSYVKIGLIAAGAALASFLPLLGATNSLRERVLLLALLLLNGWHLATLIVLFATIGFAPRRAAWCGLGLPALLVALLVGGGFLFEMERIAPPSDSLGALFALAPTMWVWGAAEHGLRRGAPWGWLYLAPVAATSFLTLRWQQRGYAICEIVGNWPSFARGVRNRGLLADSIQGISLDAPKEEATDAAHEEHETAHGEDVRKRIAAGEWRQWLVRPRWAMIDRWIRAWLTPREERLRVHLGFTPAWHTTAWLVLCALALGATLTMLQLAPAERGMDDERRFGLLALFWLCFCGVEFLAAVGGRYEAQQSQAIVAAFPLGMTEAWRLALKHAALRVPFLLLPLAGELWILGLAPWREPEVWLTEVLRLLGLTAMVAVVVHYLMFLGGTAPSRRFRTLWVNVACWLPVVIGIVATLGATMTKRDAWPQARMQVSLLALGVLLAGLVAVYFRGSYLYYRGEVDVRD